MASLIDPDRHVPIDAGPVARRNACITTVCKAGDRAALARLTRAFEEERKLARPVRCFILHRKGDRRTPRSLAHGIKAMELTEWLRQGRPFGRT